MPKTKTHRGMQLFNKDNKRLYLNESERQAFIDACYRFPPLQRSFCLMLAHTGCRLSEARFMCKEDVQLGAKTVLIKTLKRRESGHVRELPISREFALVLEIIHFGERSPESVYLWGNGSRPPPRSSCYRWVKQIMEDIGVDGPKACPRGLRHAFGIQAIRRDIQLHMVQKWLGHASMDTTAIYTTVVGQEERELASRMWN